MYNKNWLTLLKKTMYKIITKNYSIYKKTIISI